MNKSLEGVRGAAALFVVVYHMHCNMPGLGAAHGGYLAVDLFFALSGFVIARAYSDRLSSGAAFCSFIMRRIGRLYPLNFTSIALHYLLVNCALALAVQYLAHHAAPGSSIARVASAVDAMHWRDHYTPPGVNWSIHVEFMVYLIFSAVCLTLRGRARPVGFAVMAALGYTAAVYASLVPYRCAAVGDCFSMTDGFGVARCMVGFFAGALVAHYRERPLVTGLTRPVTQIAMSAATVAYLYACAYVKLLPLAAPVVFAALVASLSPDRGPVARVLHTRIIQRLGALSYSLYLAHGVLLITFGVAVAVPDSTIGRVSVAAAYLAATFMLAITFHRTIENPWRIRSQAWSKRFDTPVREDAGAATDKPRCTVQ
ncbi:acyltransferase family protein [Burkholderia guangdongensis]|uniref:acyltransferase family protein n=1 Tax=Burkholderia guangdongensis TaxID=1792500 RepID=UPI0015CAD125|nr:acyltransferase [Burkholderia guangdongensis]